MFKVGITGGIGVGKTTVCKVFELLGVPIYYSDEAAKIVIETQNVKTKIIEAFDSDVLTSDNALDKKKLAAIVFNDKSKLNVLNSIVHPAVDAHFKQWLSAHATDSYIIKEAAILFESGASLAMDKVITVTAPLELKIQRAMMRDTSTREQIEERIKNQMNDDEKIKRSNFVIYNDNQQLVIPQVINVHESIRKLINS
ncbi:MAG: dephospho-CoA kinase [Bacteroidia bacterium]